MFVRNLLQAGDFVTVIPAGIRVTLQYNEHGSIEAVYSGYKEDKVLHPEMLTSIIESSDIPNHISIQGGTSFVYGCLYTNSVYPV